MNEGGKSSYGYISTGYLPCLYLIVLVLHVELLVLVYTMKLFEDFDSFNMHSVNVAASVKYPLGSPVLYSLPWVPMAPV